MTDSTLDITQPLDRPRKLLKIIDTSERAEGDSAVIYSLAARLSSEFGAVESTPMGDLKIAEPYRVAGAVFGAAIDAVFWTAINSGAGSASGVASARGVLGTRQEDRPGRQF